MDINSNIEATDYKCLACGAVLKYNAESGTWNCEYCKSSYSLGELGENEKEFADLNEDAVMDVDEYTCPNCGAKVVTDDNTTATFCVYCRNTTIIKNRLKGFLKPKSVIPFKTTKEKAIKDFIKFKKGKPFAPKEFGKIEQISQITGVYVPFWLYDSNSEGKLDGVGLKIKKWHSGDYKYTRTDTYDVVRGGNTKFKRVPVDGATKFDNDLMDSLEPFDYNEIQNFTPAYLSGFLAEKYDVDKETAYERAEERMNNALKQFLNDDVYGYTSTTLILQEVKHDLKNTDYVLFPVWMLSINYKDEMHMFAMNGQTGKLVGDVPIDWMKFWLYFIGLFIGFSAFAFLFIILCVYISSSF